MDPKTLLPAASISQWEKIGFFHHIGINLPLSALRSKLSCGIGEFFDLIPLIEWCASLNIDIIQLLPLNDSASDPSPYNAISSIALHPIYLSLHKLPFLTPDITLKIEDLQVLNASERIPFLTVLTRKMHILSEYFLQNKTQIIASSKFASFLEQNEWVKPYALFKVFQHQLGHSPLSVWPQEIKYANAEKLQTLMEEHSDQVIFYEALQYLCFLQLSEVKKQAALHNVFLKGDIPILISSSSADIWVEPELFNLDLCAGSPPDLYAPEGQNWGFPIPHREIMKKRDFNWWKIRLHYASHFYDLYRIDHVIGLFRLWAIPPGYSAKEGYFVPKEETRWGPQGKEILDVLLTSSSMLPIAEDLGVVPNVVRPLLADLGIASTKVMRWERNWNTDKKFIDPKLYPPLSLTCVSTHDSPTLEQWWRNYPEEVRNYVEQKGWNYDSKISQEQRRVILEESISSGSLFHINLFSEYLALIPELVWQDPDMERINIPGTTLANNWAYKFRRPIEEICASPELKEEMKKLLSHKPSF